jgi:hypothetical protein
VTGKAFHVADLLVELRRILGSDQESPSDRTRSLHTVGAPSTAYFDTCAKRPRS